MPTQAPWANRFNFLYTNLGNASTSPGTSITPGASNVEGTYTQVASSANIAQEIWGVAIWVSGGNTAGQAKNHLLDLGIDEAGGTSYTAILSNIACGQSGGAVAQGCWFYFPIKIKAGSAVAVRIQGSNATAGTVRVACWFYGKPSRPELVWRGEFSETVGTITNSNGVSFTPGNTGAEGSWTSLGTTTKFCKWWQLGVQIDNGTIAGAFQFTFDLAYGDVTNKHMILENVQYCIHGTAETAALYAIDGSTGTGFCPVPVGGELWIRGSCSGTAPTGCNAVAIGVG